jgi:hypothetical protein
MAVRKSKMQHARVPPNGSMNAIPLTFAGGWSEQFDTDVIAPARLVCATNAGRISRAPRAHCIRLGAPEKRRSLLTLSFDAIAEKPLRDAVFIGNSATSFRLPLVNAAHRRHVLNRVSNRKSSRRFEPSHGRCRAVGR